MPRLMPSRATLQAMGARMRARLPDPSTLPRNPTADHSILDRHNRAVREHMLQGVPEQAIPRAPRGVIAREDALSFLRHSLPNEFEQLVERANNDALPTPPVVEDVGDPFDVMDRVLLVHYNGINDTPDLEKDDVYVVELCKVRTLKTYTVRDFMCQRIDFHIKTNTRFTGSELKVARRRLALLVQDKFMSGYQYFRDGNMMDDFIMRHPEFQKLGNGKSNPTRGIPQDEINAELAKPRRVIDLL